MTISHSGLLFWATLYRYVSNRYVVIGFIIRKKNTI